MKAHDSMTAKMRVALDAMKRAREEDPTTDDGILTSLATFYDVEVAVAYVHFRTAEALVKAGHAQYGEWYGPDDGQALVLRRDANSQPGPPQ